MIIASAIRSFLTNSIILIPIAIQKRMNPHILFIKIFFNSKINFNIIYAKCIFLFLFSEKKGIIINTTKIKHPKFKRRIFFREC